MKFTSYDVELTLTKVLKNGFADEFLALPGHLVKDDEVVVTDSLVSFMVNEPKTRINYLYLTSEQWESFFPENLVFKLSYNMLKPKAIFPLETDEDLFNHLKYLIQYTLDKGDDRQTLLNNFSRLTKDSPLLDELVPAVNPLRFFNDDMPMIVDEDRGDILRVPINDKLLPFLPRYTLEKLKAEFGDKVEFEDISEIKKGE